MTDPAQGLAELWDRAVLLAERLTPADLRRATPDPGLDVGGLVAHVATVPGGGRSVGDLLEALHTARERQPGIPPGPRAERLAGARCLDLYVHTHDLAVALGDPVDLHDDSAGATAAYDYLRRLTPHLAARAGLPAGDVITATPAAYVLLLSGRADPERARDERALEWSGAGGAAFAERVRI